MQNSKLKIQKWVLLFCIFNLAFLIGGCGIPNLETPECAEARDAAKQFYSLHFGTDMRPSAENLKLRERFLTPRFFAMLSAAGENTLDQFTMTQEYPRTFKIGECNANTPTNIDLQLQLYWRDDQKTVQQEVVANMVKENDKWLLDGVGSKKR